MALTASIIKIILRYTYLGQKCENIQYYRPDGAAFLTATMDTLLEAYWNDIKTAARGIMTNYIGDASWDSLLGEEIGGGLAYAEYAVPTGERVGTRSTTGLGDPVSSFSAGGVRLAVATRATRPGQKRFPFLFEADVDRNALGATYLTLLTALGLKFSAQITLGAPVATGVLHPIVTRHDHSDPPIITASQDVIGQVVNQDVTTQVSRKKGRGA